MLIGAIRIPDAQTQPTLVVDAEADRLEALRLQLGPRHGEPSTVFRQAVLAANSQEDVTWFRFNDSRLNGVVPLERWQPHYPNLLLMGEEALSAQTLADILDNWPAAENDQLGIDLTLAQGHPLQVLSGADRWLQRLQWIRLKGPRARELWWDCCDPWLQQRGFRPDPQTPLCWTLDPIYARTIQQQGEIEAGRLKHEQEIRLMTVRRDPLMTALRHVFPYSTYRQLRPDIAAFSEQALVDHFVDHGIHEGINLQFSCVESELQQLRAEQDAQSKRSELLNEKTRHTAQQLDLLKDLFARLMVNP